MKKMDWDKLLEGFVRFVALDMEIIKSDPEGYSRVLYDAINEAGFGIEPGCEIDLSHASLLRVAIFSVLHALLPESSVSDLQIEIKPVTVTAVWDGRKPGHIMNLGQSGVDGVVLVLRIVMAMQGITVVKECEECGHFFFPKRADRKFCYPPKQCKNNYHGKRRNK